MGWGCLVENEMEALTRLPCCRAGLIKRFDDPAMTKEVSRYRAFYELVNAEAKTQQANPLKEVDFSKYKSHVSSEGALKKIAELEVREEKRDVCK